MQSKKTFQPLIVFILMAAICLCGISAGASGQAAGALAAGDGNRFRYTEEGYYQPPYLFVIGWNLPQTAAGYAGREITLPDGGTLPVLFDDDCKSCMEDKEAMAHLTALLSQLRQAADGGDCPLTRPLVMSAQYVGGDVNQLASEFDGAGALPQFAAVFAWLSEDVQRAYLDTFYRQGRIAFFAACLDRLAQGGPWLDEYAQRAYEDGQTAYFALLAGHMDAKRLQAWIERAKAGQNTNVLAILIDAQTEAARGLVDGEEAGIVRLGKKELPDGVLKAMDHCAIRTWYLIQGGQRQYLYYNGLGANYAWQPQQEGNCLTVSIVPLSRKGHGYVLLCAPAGVELSVSYQGETVPLTALMAEGQ